MEFYHLSRTYLFAYIVEINKPSFIEPKLNELFFSQPKWPEHKNPKIFKMYKTADLLFIWGWLNDKDLKIQMHIYRITERLVSLQNVYLK